MMMMMMIDDDQTFACLIARTLANEDGDLCSANAACIGDLCTLVSSSQALVRRRTLLIAVDVTDSTDLICCVDGPIAFRSGA